MANPKLVVTQVTRDAVISAQENCRGQDRADMPKKEAEGCCIKELHRAIIYTTKTSKQMTKNDVRDAVHMYPVN
jgi:hypothetical protein